jgi:hypothetical protein
VKVVKDAIGTSFTVEVAPADFGRGASGYAAALQIVEAIGGVAAATLYQGAKKITVAAYRAVRRRLGRRPFVSLGAAKHLATADLIERAGFDDFLLVGAGDVATPPPDQSFTGADQFWVVFERFPDLFVYIVDGAGRCHYMGFTTLYKDGWLEYQEGLLAIIESRVLRSSNVAVQDQRESRSGIIGFRGWRGGALRV